MKCEGCKYLMNVFVGMDYKKRKKTCHVCRIQLLDSEGTGDTETNCFVQYEGFDINKLVDEIGKLIE